MNAPLRILPPRWFHTLASTNLWLREQLVAGHAIEPGATVAARTQSAGRGRNERTWQSGQGNLAWSIYIVSRRPLPELPSLPMVCALAVAGTLERFGIQAHVKWPNDVPVDGKKICGILSEIVGISDGMADVIVGIGINVTMTAAECDRIGRPATSIRLETGAAVESKALIEALIPALEHWVNRWERDGFAPIRPEWKTHAYRLGEEIRIENAGERRTGVFHDIGDAGEMVLARNGALERVYLGDVE